MSDGWFDRSYRSVEMPSEELDARILAAARRATRRWTPPGIAAGALTIMAAAVLGFLISGHELYVPPDEAPGVGPTADVDGFRIDVLQPSGEPDRLSPPTEFASPGMISEPDMVPLPDPLAEVEETMEPQRTAPEFDCGRSALVGSLGGPARRDLVQICSGDGTLYIDVVWDGDPACPSQFEIDSAPGASVGLEGRELVFEQARLRCERGQWVRVDPERLPE